jgi:predicted nucleic acid-binding protein
LAQVIDASVAVGWCVKSQSTALSEGALKAVRADGGFVPPQFWFEVLHAIARAERRGSVTTETIEKFLDAMPDLPLTMDGGHECPGMVGLFHLARRYRLNIYDVSYLELALRLDLPLATRDVALARAAEQAGAKLFTA